MLKITVENQAEHPKILLDGKLAGEWVNEVEQVWKTLSNGGSAEDVTFDLSGVTFVDSEGKKLLGSLLGRGAKLEEPRLLVKYIVDEIKAGRNQRPLE